mmetsp:Transcript_88867/g.162954  ORF Transcript_88867/g.162954 Transcript_88867/m.162954 type:complete len:310 (-) Transcript_88867:178-1107(-)
MIGHGSSQVSPNLFLWRPLPGSPIIKFQGQDYFHLQAATFRDVLQMAALSYDWPTVLQYGLGTYLVIIGSWVSACIPFVMMDHFSWGQVWRIQKNAKGEPVRAAVDPYVRRRAAKMVIVNWTWLLPVNLLAAPVYKELFPADAPAPAWWQAPFLGLLWFLLHDICFYCYHRLLHEVPSLYKHVHKQHHIFTAPFAWTSIATHPVETLLQSVGGLLGPLLHSAFFGLPVHALWIWLGLITIQGVFDHSGYDLPLPFDIFGMLPGFGGTHFHDDHHRYFNCNYAAAFSMIDDFMGTSRQSGYLEKQRSKQL